MSSSRGFGHCERRIARESVVEVSAAEFSAEPHSLPVVFRENVILHVTGRRSEWRVGKVGLDAKDGQSQQSAAVRHYGSSTEVEKRIKLRCVAS